MRRIRLLLADDQELFVDSLKYVLEGIARDFDIVGIARNGVEAVDLAKKHQPDVVLMDVRMPEMDGVEATRAINLLHPNIKIVMLTTFADDEYVHFALKYGAVGYLLKNLPPEDLVAAVRAVIHGTKLFSPEIVPKIDRTEYTASELDELLNTLSKREKEVVSLLIQLKSNSQIAEKLGIADQTVRNHISSVYSHFEIYDRMELIQTLRRIWRFTPQR